jgi:hypothetical protein
VAVHLDEPGEVISRTDVLPKRAEIRATREAMRQGPIQSARIVRIVPTDLKTARTRARREVTRATLTQAIQIGETVPTDTKTEITAPGKMTIAEIIKSSQLVKTVRADSKTTGILLRRHGESLRMTQVPGILISRKEIKRGTNPLTPGRGLNLIERIATQNLIKVISVREQISRKNQKRRLIMTSLPLQGRSV